MSTPRPLTNQDLLLFDGLARPKHSMSIGISVVIGAASFLASLHDSGWWTVGGLALALVAIVAWWWRNRARGMRFNNYSPMKTDEELARTGNSSPEQQRLMFMQIVVFGFVYGSRLFDFAWYPFVTAALTTIFCMWMLLSIPQIIPGHKPIPKLIEDNAEISITQPDQWMLAFLYAHRVAPGGFQWRNDSLKEAAERSGMDGKQVDKTLSTLYKRKQAITIRELRSTDGAINWVTLTEDGVKAGAKLLSGAGQKS